jgi:hypothetical protein
MYLDVTTTSTQEVSFFDAEKVVFHSSSSSPQFHNRSTWHRSIHLPPVGLASPAGGCERLVTQWRLGSAFRVCIRSDRTLAIYCIVLYCIVLY